MRLRKLLLLNVYTFSLLVGGITQSRGAEDLTREQKHHRTETNPIAANAVTLHDSPESTRSSSSTVSEYEGKYVHSDPRGIVTIKQDRYPTYIGVQNLRLVPRIISELRIDPGNNMPYHLIDPKDLVGPFEAANIETTESIINVSGKPFVIVEPEKAKEKPYSSCGRLTMTFPQNASGDAQSFYGSGAALDKNLVITAAHNFLPQTYNNHHNVDRVRAEEVVFHHMLTTANVSDLEPVQPAKVSTHCFVHPKWEESFDPKYDVALLFLSDSLKLSPEHINALLKLRIHNGKEETVQIVGHPKGLPRMRESTGKARWEQTIDSEQIIYHFVNTLPGSSGSPIISEDLHIVGTHTRGAGEETNGANSGVRMRKELLPFIEESIKTHQAFLENAAANASAFEELRSKQKREAEQALIDKGLAAGKAEGEKAKAIEIARGMLTKKMDISLISELTGLTADEIKDLK
jgi:V8-like Glu-specific endopeptidase